MLKGNAPKDLDLQEEQQRSGNGEDVGKHNRLSEMFLFLKITEDKLILKWNIIWKGKGPTIAITAVKRRIKWEELLYLVLGLIIQLPQARQCSIGERIHTYRSMKQNKGPKNRPTQIRPTCF